MRVLFLHAAQSGWTSEYKVHATLSSYARSDNFVPYYIWQDPIDAARFGLERVVAFDFGRHAPVGSYPSRLRRVGSVLGRLPHTFPFLISKIGQIRPDVIYTSQQSVDLLLAGLVSKLYRIPHVIHLHFNVGPWLGSFALQTIQRSSRLIAVSEYIRQTALLQGIAPSRIHTVVNPAATTQSQPQPKCAAKRAEFGIDAKAPLVLAVGRLDEGKGHLDLIEAFALVARAMPDARLIICGASTYGSNYETRLRQRVVALELQPHVIFAGYRNDIPAIMGSADVFCLPTELDPCPLVFLEAMGEAMPVVAYYSGGVPEIVLPNQTGLLCYPGDIPMLAANLLKILGNASYAKQLGDAGRRRVATDFAPATIAERWLRVMQEMVK